MTQNQLKYWELRWKQVYEKAKLEEEARANRAKERETERHNRVSERQEAQRIIMEKINLSQAQEKINQEWAKISLSYRQQAVYEIVKQQEIQLEFDKLMSSNKLAIADLAVKAQHYYNQDVSNYISSVAKALDTGWGEGTAALGLGIVLGQFGNSYATVVDTVGSQLGIDTSEFKTTFEQGVQLAQKSISRLSSKDENIPDNVRDVLSSQKNLSTKQKSYLDGKWGPDVQGKLNEATRSGWIPNVAVPSNATRVSSAEGKTNTHVDTIAGLHSVSSASVPSQTTATRSTISGIMYAPSGAKSNKI